MPSLIAHRGYPRHYPENTLAGLAAAIDHGARHVEIDVQVSREGVPVLFHDGNLARLCGLPGRITALDATAIRALRVGGEPVPTLAEFAGLLQQHPGLHAFVELKRESIEQIGESALLAAVIETLVPVRSQCTLISFHAGALSLATGWRTGWVTEAWPESLPPDIALWFCDVAALPPEGPVNPFTVPLAVYEVSDPGLAEELAARGAELIETNDIGGMRRALPAWT